MVAAGPGITKEKMQMFQAHHITIIPNECSSDQRSTTKSSPPLVGNNDGLVKYNGISVEYTN